MKIPPVDEIKKIVNQYNRQTAHIDIPVFNKIRDITRYHGFPGFTLKEEARRNLGFDERLFVMIYSLQDKLCALNYHLSSLAVLKETHRRALAKFAALFARGPSCSGVHIVHGAAKLRYEFEAFQFQFKAALDLLATIIYHLYRTPAPKSPFRKLRNVLQRNLNGKYLTDEILGVLTDNDWTEEFLSRDGILSKRDKAAHFPWQLRYDYAELKHDGREMRYDSMREEGGKEVYEYCREYYLSLFSTPVEILLDRHEY